jgi:hypothetical protein
MQFGHRTPASGGIAKILLILAVAVSACGDGTDGRVIPDEIPFRADGILDIILPDSSVAVRIAIEVAASDSAQARGLMERRSLPQRGGMLFVDAESREREFWMRNTPLPLDIIFIRADRTIANIARRTTPYSDERIRSEGPAQYVLEVRAGFTDLYAIDDSARVNWRIQP